MPIKRLSLMCAKRGAAAFLAAVVCVLLMPSYTAHAQEKVLTPAVLSDGSDPLPLGPHTLLQKDADGKITPQTIVQSGGRVLTGKVLEKDSLHLGYDGTPVWLVTKLQGDAVNDEWIIDLGRRSEGRLGHLKSVRAYEMQMTSPLTLRELRSDRGEDSYGIRLARGEEKFILFHMTPAPGKPTIIPLRVLSESSYVSSVKSQAAFDLGYCLTLAVFGSFFAAIAMAGRKLSYTIFGAYFFFTLAFWLSYNHAGAQLGQGISGDLVLFFALGYSIFAIYMTKIFWGIEYGSYTEKYILYGLVWLNIVATALSILLPVGDGIAHIALQYGAPVTTIAIICLMSLAQSRSFTVKENLYMLSWLFPLTGLAIMILAACQLLPATHTVLNSFWYLLVPQGLVMGLALMRRFAEMGENERGRGSGDMLSLHRLKETKESADNSRLLKVIQKEREMLAEFRTKEAIRTEEMRIAKEAADAANREKSAFLAVVSHEIRTPMTGVMGMVRLLLDSNISKQQRDYALTIKESGEAMLGLLNDILDFEKIQRGKIELENISLDLHRLIQGVVTLMSGHAAEKNISLSARMDDDIPRFVKGDPTRLRQVLLNLMGNAIKFTEKGHVTLFVKNMNQPELEEHDIPLKQGNPMIYFAVQDSGIGIPAEAQKNLFNPFSQANAGVARKFGGSGLGLAISKGLVEIMGSTININSKEGEGSTFFFTLEMERGVSLVQEQPRPYPPPPEEQPIEPMKILVVDDNNITRKVITSFLEQGGHTVASAGTAEEALKRINQDAFEFIFMDIELPGMRGDEATKILRGHPDRVKAALPVVAITGNVGKEETDHYIAAGMTGVLHKPVEADKLKSVMRDILKNRDANKITMPPPDFIPDIEIDDNFDSFAPPPVETKPAEAAQGVFNPDMLKSLKEAIGAKQLGELLTDLITKTEEILGQMDEASKIGDLQALAARAHELKGMAGNFGLLEISSIAAQAEKKAKTNETDGLGALLGSLPGASARAQTALKDWAAH